MPLDGSAYEIRTDALTKMDKVIDLLAREDRWTKQQLQTHDGRRCILGAMMAADATVVLKEPILLAVQQVTGRPHGRIELWNDLPSTTHGDVLAVLQRARANILAGDAPPSPPPREGMFTRLWRRVAA